MSPLANRPGSADTPRAVEASTVSNQGSVKAANSEQPVFRLDVRRSLQLHRRLAFTIAAIGLLLGTIYYIAMDPVYQALCLVYVQPAPPSVIQQGYSTRWPYDATTYDSYIQQQIQNVMREDVLTSALKKLGDSGKRPSESDQDALDRLRRGLDVARVGQTYQFTIGARASNPELAAQTANAVAESYIESTVHDQKAGDEQRLTMLREERDRVQSALDADRAEQEDLNKQLGVASVGGAPDHFDQDITEIRTELVKARTEHDAAEARFAAMGAGHGSSSSAIDAAADESANADAGLVSMKTSLNARKAFLISKMANLTPSNPEYKQDAAELAQINTNLDQMMKELSNRAASHIQLQLRSELERTAGVEAQLNGQLRQLVSSATNATSKLQRASDLAADITRLQSRYSTVDEQLHNRMLEDAAPTGAYISTPAQAPDHRAKSGKTRNALVIVGAGLFFGLLAAVVRNKLDQRVYVGSDVERVLGLSPMAMIPDFAEVTEGAAEEHLLRLAAAIEHANKQGHLRNCVFTGAGSGVGVTTIVTRVRTLLEAMGRSTVYVDASGTSAQDEAAAARGFSETQALIAVSGRNRQTALSHQMAGEGDDETLVLTDASPIAVSAETEYLARFADCAIVVIESGITTQTEIRDAAATLERLNVGAVGFVLNRVGLAKADPAFRASVEAIEKHLQSQMGTVARRTKANAAVVSAGLTDSTAMPVEMSPAVSVRDSEPAPVSQLQPRPSNPPAPGQATVSASEPSWRITSEEPLFSKSWTPDWRPAGALADSADARPLGTVASADSFKAQPAASFEPISWREPSLINRQDSASLPTVVSPVMPQASTEHLRLGDSGSRGEPIGDPINVKRDKETARREPLAAISPTGPVPVVHHSMWAQREQLPASVQPDTPRGDENQTVAVAPIGAEKPVLEADPDIPWWLSDVPGQLPEQATPLLWQGEKTDKSGRDASHLKPGAVEAHKKGNPSWMAGSDSSVQLPKNERIAGGADYRAAMPAEASNYPGESEDSPERLTSRLSGLRSLLAGLGLKEVHSSGGALDPANAHRMPLDQGGRAVDDSRVDALKNTNSTSPVGQAALPRTQQVSAQPEFLKPAAHGSEYEVGDSKMGEKSLVRSFEPIGDFEEPTLPSRRGQYRNL